MDGDDWRPIETAPKDGTVILLARAGESGPFGSEGEVYAGAHCPLVKGEAWPWVLLEHVARPDITGCCDRENDERIEVNGWQLEAPTHWQPLPPPPMNTNPVPVEGV